MDVSAREGIRSPLVIPPIYAVLGTSVRCSRRNNREWRFMIICKTDRDRIRLIEALCTAVEYNASLIDARMTPYARNDERRKPIRGQATYVRRLKMEIKQWDRLRMMACVRKVEK